MRIMITNALTDVAAQHFHNAPEFIGRGFEMIPLLRDTHAANSEEEIFVNFMELSEMSQESGETVSTFSDRLRANFLRISDGGLEIPVLYIGSSLHLPPHHGQRYEDRLS